MTATTLAARCRPGFAARRHLSAAGGFSFAGPRKLKDILKSTETLGMKTSSEIADVWYTYHETKVSSLSVRTHKSSRPKRKAALRSLSNALTRIHLSVGSCGGNLFEKYRWSGSFRTGQEMVRVNRMASRRAL